MTSIKKRAAKGGNMWMVEDAIEGAPTVGKGKHGQDNRDVMLRLTGKQHYQLQKFLKEACTNQTNPYEVRMAVLLWEATRTQIECLLERSEKG